MSTPFERNVVRHVRKTRGWKPAATRYELTITEVKDIMRRNALREAGKL